MHHQWLDDWQDDTSGQPGGVGDTFDNANFPDVATAMKNATTAIGGNPYAGAVAYSPDVDLANAQDAIDDFNADLAAGWTSFLTSTIEGIDATFASPVEFKGIENVVSDRIRRERNKDVATFNGRALEIGAIQSSTYAMAVVYEEQLTRTRINEFITDHENKMKEVQILLLGQLGGFRLDGFRALSAQQGQMAQLTTVAKSDEQETNQQLEVKEGTWDLQLFRYGSNVLASISGGVTGQDEGQTDLARAASAVAMGASTALALGAAGTAGAGASTAMAAVGGPVGISIAVLVTLISFVA